MAAPREQYLEPLTHFLTGACLGRAGLNRKTALATLTLTLATESPDIDMLAYFGGSVTGFAHHRGFTHSLLGAPVLALLILAIVRGIYALMKARGHETKTPINWKLLYLYAVFGCLIHLLQDFTNNYGIRPFAPFNFKWYSWDIVFILDPIMMVALLLGLFVPGLLRLVSDEVGAAKQQFRGRGGAIAALVCLVLVILVRDIEHRRALNLLNSVTYQNQEALRVSAYPKPLSPFEWNGVVETSNFFQLLPVNVSTGQLDPDNQSLIRYKPEETAVTLAAKKSRLGRVYLDWAKYPLVETQKLPGTEGYQVTFADLRFAETRVPGLSSGSRQGRSQPLRAYVLLDPQLRVYEMAFGTPPYDAR
jgi:inner membrane protein